MPAEGEPKTPMGHAIRRLRKAKGYNSGKELGLAADLTQSRVSELELGQYPPRLDEIERLEATFGLPRGGLLVEAGWLTLDVSTRDQIRMDPRLDPGPNRDSVVDAYDSAVRRSGRGVDDGSTAESASPTNATRRRKSANS